MAGAINPLIIVLLLGMFWVIVRWRSHRLSQPAPPAINATLHRLLKPRTPDDCPACRRSRAQTPFQRTAGS